MLTCDKCVSVFSTQSSLNKHLKMLHNILNIVSYDYEVYASKCVQCLCSFKCIKTLREHLIQQHEWTIDTVETEFGTLEDFNLWLSSEQAENNVQYIKARGQKLNTIYYNCNRSITRKKRKQTEKRLPKSQGSCKIDTNCISQIKVEIKDKILVKYYKTHNHEIEVQHLRILSEDRNNIAAKLKAGVSVKKILNDIRDNIGGPQIKRIDIVSRKDINNIKTAFDINSSEEGKKHKSDVISIDLWVQEQKQLDNNCVLLYKKQGEDAELLEKDDFCLIIMNHSQEFMLVKFGHNIIAIDSTHGLNNYDFDLTTLMVIDEFGSGFPAACMFSNKKDTRINEVFFSCIKQKLGFPIETTTFMSDITGVFYNAWVKIMGTPCQQLYCAWHIDRAWQKNLNKIRDLEKRKWVYKTIKYLQMTTDENNFLLLLNSGINLFKNDEDTVSFGNYFEEYYSKNYKLWAYCYRKSCNINTNMHLESMHKTLKYFYLDGKKVQRLDKGLHFLLKFIRDKLVERLIKGTKGKTTTYHKEIADRHRNSIVNANNFKVITRSDDKCIISMNDKSSFEVTKVSNVVCCHFDCKYCQVCIHTYNCQCGIFYSTNTICEHIHYVAFNNILQNNDCLDINVPSTEEINTHLDTLQNEETKESSIGVQEKIHSKLNEISKKCYKVTNETVLNEVLDYLKRGSAIMDLHKENAQLFSFSKEKNLEPPNKKIKKQLIFHSTKKTRAKKTFMKKPTREEINIIDDELNKKLYINKGEADHDYF